jgi:hypothetical protein
MLEFHPATVADRDWVADRMRCAGVRGSDYTFANLLNWADVYQIVIAKMDDFLIIRSGRGPFGYLFPAGEGDLRSVIDAIHEDSLRQGHDMLLYNLPREAVDTLESLYPGRFTFKGERNNFDYIYTRESLMTLAGKKLHGKRNHIARFKENNPDWTYEPLTKENLSEAWEMNTEWCNQNDCSLDESLRKEACAVRNAFRYFEEERLVGGLLRVGGRVIAYTMGSPVTDDTFVVHIEKAFSDIQGAYPMINQQFVTNALEGYTYVNREDDVGDLGLRKAKLSYHPVMMYERFEAFDKEKT